MEKSGLRPFDRGTSRTARGRRPGTTQVHSGAAFGNKLARRELEDEALDVPRRNGRLGSHESNFPFHPHHGTRIHDRIDH